MLSKLYSAFSVNRKYLLVLLLTTIGSIFTWYEVPLTDWSTFVLILYGAFAGANVTQKVFAKQQG